MVGRTGLAPLARRVHRAVQALHVPEPMRSDGEIESLNCELAHFVLQPAVLTALPSIYHPHDLQHLHLPQFFSARELAYRRVAYRAFCEAARIVAVASRWTAQDVHRHLQIPLDKIAVVPLAPPTEAYEPADPADLARMRQAAGGEDFIFYPAQTWAHKNHINLLRALRRLREAGLRVPLVSSGHQNEFFPTIAREMAALGLQDQVRFLGFVAERDVMALYQLCRFVVVPSRFEAVSGPIWEAFAAGKTVAAATVTSLPEQVGDCGLLFDPDDLAGMADCIGRLWRDDRLRDGLGHKGAVAVRKFTWERTARHFRALYRRILGAGLSEEDEAILAAPPLI